MGSPALLLLSLHAAGTASATRLRLSKPVEPAVSGLTAKPLAQAAAQPVQLSSHNSTSVANATVNGTANTTIGNHWPYSCVNEPAVGKVCALYYSSSSDAKITQIFAQDNYAPATRVGDVWQGARILPVPSCALQLKSMTNYPTDNRKANMRLAELAVCDLLKFRDLGAKHPAVPDCGAGEGQVCELEISAPLPGSDEHSEPFVGGALALAAYSKICALFEGPGNEYKCEVHRNDDAIMAGLSLVGAGAPQLSGPTLPGLLDLKLDDAYTLRLTEVTLAESSKDVYARTEFHQNLPDVLHWQHTPPKISFCQDVQCLVNKFIR